MSAELANTELLQGELQGIQGNTRFLQAYDYIFVNWLTHNLWWINELFTTEYVPAPITWLFHLHLRTTPKAPFLEKWNK